MQRPCDSSMTGVSGRARRPVWLQLREGEGEEDEEDGGRKEGPEGGDWDVGFSPSRMGATGECRVKEEHHLTFVPTGTFRPLGKAGNHWRWA